MSWLREAISDENQQADIAYVVIAMLSLAVVFSIAFLFAMSAWDYSVCKPITTLATGTEAVTHIQPCRFDPLPLGQSTGLIFAAYATLFGGLSAYMIATRRPAGGGAKTTTAVTPTATTTVTEMDPVAAEATPPKKPKGRGR